MLVLRFALSDVDDPLREVIAVQFGDDAEIMESGDTADAARILAEIDSAGPAVVLLDHVVPPVRADVVAGTDVPCFRPNVEFTQIPGRRDPVSRVVSYIPI